MLGLEDFFQALEDLDAERRELGSAMVDGGIIDRAQHPIGNVGRAWDLKKMTAGVEGHGWLLRWGSGSAYRKCVWYSTLPHTAPSPSAPPRLKAGRNTPVR